MPDIVSTAGDRIIVQPVPSTLDAASTTPTTHEEALRTLRDLAHRKTGKVPADLVAAHVIAITPDADWPVRRAAIEAIIRRRQSADRERLKIVARPPRGAPFGFYRTASSTSKTTYEACWISRSPFAGSCSCADYLRNSLGICKHLWTILEADFAKRSKRMGQPPGIALTWDPVRPLTGNGDPLDRIRWDTSTPGMTAAQTKLLTRRFASGSGPVRSLNALHADSPELRLELVRELLRVVNPSVRATPATEIGALVDPAIRPLLNTEAVRLQRLVENAPMAADVNRLSKGLKRKLYPYQLEGVTAAVGRGRLLLADDMGLGKTAQAIATCHVLTMASRVQRGLIIVPSALKPQWLREWDGFTSIPATIVDGSADERAAIYKRTTSGFLIANYEQLHRDLGHMEAWAPDLVVLDEAQRIKNWQTKTAAAAKRLNPPYRLVLTGTPMENRLDELASVLDWVDDQALEPKWRLSPWHSIATDGSKEARGARNLSTLRERLSRSFLRRRRAEVLSQLPSRSDTRVPVELTLPQIEAHDEFIQPIAQLIARGRRRPLTQPEFLRLMSMLTQQRILCNGMALHDYEEVSKRLRTTRPTEAAIEGLFTPKLRELRELVTQLVVNQGLKVVIFSQWRRMLSLAEWATSDILRASDHRAAYFSGGESQKRRTQNIVDFHDDPRMAVLFATDAGGVGLNLQHAASACINLELPWNPAVLEQRIGRIYRLGQKKPVEIYNLVAEAGIEARIASLVADKKALFSGLFDGTSDEVKFEGAGSFLSRVEKLVGETSNIGSAPSSTIMEESDEDAVISIPSDGEEPEGDGAGDESIAELPLLAAESASLAGEGIIASPIAEASAIEVTAAPPSRADAAAVEEPRGASSHTQPAAAEGKPALDLEGFRGLLGQVRLQMRPDGGVTLDAPKEAAATLAMLFGEMARKLAEVAAPPPM